MATAIALRRASHFTGSFQLFLRPCRHFTVLLPILTSIRNPSTSGPLGVGFQRLGFHDHLGPNRNARGFAKGRKSSEFFIFLFSDLDLLLFFVEFEVLNLVLTRKRFGLTILTTVMGMAVVESRTLVQL